MAQRMHDYRKLVFSFFVYPAVSPGASWFRQLSEKLDLPLVGTHPFENGVVELDYVPRELAAKARPERFTELLT